jgi:hypothetical protein
MKLQYTFTRKYFLRGPAFPRTPPTEGIAPPDPAGGVTLLAVPRMDECTFFWGEKSSWGINTTEKKRPLNEEDNQSPQPTISHLETNINKSIIVVSIRL